jgi:hypothetical protein
MIFGQEQPCQRASKKLFPDELAHGYRLGTFRFSLREFLLLLHNVLSSKSNIPKVSLLMTSMFRLLKLFIERTSKLSQPPFRFDV